MISEFEDSFEVRKEAKGERYNTTENSVVRSRDVGTLYRKLKMPDAVERRQHCGLVQLRWVTRERERAAFTRRCKRVPYGTTGMFTLSTRSPL